MAGAAAVVAGAALPWLDTGGVKRSAFTMARIANELGVLDTGARRFAVTALLFTPIIACAVLFLLSLGRNRLGGLVALPLGIAGLGAGTIGTRFSPSTLVGPYVCLVGGALCILGAWGLLLTPRRATGPQFVVAALGLIGIAAGGAFALTQLTGRAKANTPEQAVEGFYRSFERGDFIGMSKALAPGERDVLLDSVVPMVAELSRLEILKKDFSLDRVEGYTAKVTNYRATSTILRPDLASVVVTGGNLQASVDPKNFPLGDFLRRQFGQEIDSAEASTRSARLRVGTENNPLVVQKVGTRWYISANYSLAESVRRSSKDPGNVPARGAGIPAKGSKTAAGAVREMIQASANLDLRRVIELLPPDEFAALHDYAGGFIISTEMDLADIRKQYTLETTAKLKVMNVSGDRRLVQIVDLPLTFTATVNKQNIVFKYKNKTAKASFTSKDGEDLSADFRNNCLTIVLEGEKKKGCGRDGFGKLFTDLTGTPIDLTSLPLSTTGIAGPCATTEKPVLGFTVIERAGLWYVSPLRTTLDTITATLKTLNRDDIDCFAREIRNVADPAAPSR